MTVLQMDPVAVQSSQMMEFVTFGRAIKKRNQLRLPCDLSEIANPRVFDQGTIYRACKDEVGFKPLFASSLLNQCHFEKMIAGSASSGLVLPGRIVTKITFPFDVRSGFEATHGQRNYMYLFERGFEQKVADAFNGGMPIEFKEQDLKVLQIIEEMPSYDAFLLKDKFDLENVYIDQKFAEVSDEQFSAIKAPILAEFEKVIDKIVGEQEVKNRDLALEKLFQAFWYLDDMESLQGLIGALKINPDEAPQIFYSWKGLLYYIFIYQERFFDIPNILSSIKRVIHANTTSNLERTTHQIEKILDLHQRFQGFVTSYKETFETAFSSSESLGEFIQVLKNAPELYWMIGYAIGVLSSVEMLFQNLKTLPHGSDQKYHETIAFLESLEG